MRVWVNISIHPSTHYSPERGLVERWRREASRLHEVPRTTPREVDRGEIDR